LEHLLASRQRAGLAGVSTGPNAGRVDVGASTAGSGAAGCAC